MSYHSFQSTHLGYKMNYKDLPSPGHLTRTFNKEDYDKTGANKGGIPERTAAECFKKLCLCAANVCKKPKNCQTVAKVYNATGDNQCTMHGTESCISCSKIQHWNPSTAS